MEFFDQQPKHLTGLRFNPAPLISWENSGEGLSIFSTPPGCVWLCGSLEQKSLCERESSLPGKPILLFNRYYYFTLGLIDILQATDRSILIFSILSISRQGPYLFYKFSFCSPLCEERAGGVLQCWPPQDSSIQKWLSSSSFSNWLFI